MGSCAVCNSERAHSSRVRFFRSATPLSSGVFGGQVTREVP